MLSVLTACTRLNGLLVRALSTMAAADAGVIDGGIPIEGFLLRQP